MSTTRADLAARAAKAYAGTGRVDAVVLAGSVGRGRDDANSDLELDVFWAEPPTDSVRRFVVESLDGEIEQLWPYEPDEGEWSDDYRVDGIDVGVSGFTTPWMDECIGDVVERFDPAILKQLRLSALHEGRCLYGEHRVEHWRSRSRAYPDELVANAAAEFLEPGRLGSWYQRYALLDRNDLPILRALCGRIPPMILGALSAVNRRYIEHPQFKWASASIARFEVAPTRLDERLNAATDGPVETAVRTLDELIQETVDLVAQYVPSLDLGELRHELNRSR